MEEVLKLVIGAVVLVAGFFIGDYLAKITREELKSGQIWFKSTILLSVIGTILALIFRNDVLLFTFLFVATVTGRSLKKK